jgi:hypothetical protein
VGDDGAHHVEPNGTAGSVVLLRTDIPVIAFVVGSTWLGAGEESALATRAGSPMGWAGTPKRMPPSPPLSPMGLFGCASGARVSHCRQSAVRSLKGVARAEVLVQVPLHQ